MRKPLGDPHCLEHFQNAKSQKNQKTSKQKIVIFVFVCFWLVFCEFWFGVPLPWNTIQIALAIRLAAANSCMSPCLGVLSNREGGERNALGALVSIGDMVSREYHKPWFGVWVCVWGCGCVCVCVLYVCVECFRRITESG